jgi:hypothetical protein
LSDVCKFAKDEDHARNQSDVLLEPVVDVVKDFVRRETADFEEPDERSNDWLKAALEGKHYDDAAFRKFLRRCHWRALWVWSTRALEEIYRQKGKM